MVDSPDDKKELVGRQSIVCPLSYTEGFLTNMPL